MTAILDKLTGLMNRSHQSQLSAVSVAEMAAMAARNQKQFDRLDSQIDVQLKRCFPEYEPPTDEMEININNGIQLDSESMQALIKEIADEPKDTNEPSDDRVKSLEAEIAKLRAEGANRPSGERSDSSNPKPTSEVPKVGREASALQMVRGLPTWLKWLGGAMLLLGAMGGGAGIQKWLNPEEKSQFEVVTEFAADADLQELQNE